MRFPKLLPKTSARTTYLVFDLTKFNGHGQTVFGKTLYMLSRLKGEEHPVGHVGFLLSDGTMLGANTADNSMIDSPLTEDFKKYPDNYLVVELTSVAELDIIEAAEATDYKGYDWEGCLRVIFDGTPLKKLFKEDKTDTFFCSEFVMHLLVKSGAFPSPVAGASSGWDDIHPNDLLEKILSEPTSKIISAPSWLKKENLKAPKPIAIRLGNQIVKNEALRQTSPRPDCSEVLAARSGGLRPQKLIAQVASRVHYKIT